MDNVFADDTDPAVTSKPTASADDYLQLVKKSGLVVESVLGGAVEMFKQRHQKRSNDAASLAYFLIQQKLVTPWQTKMLLLGRCRGFVLGKYKLLDQIGLGGMSTVYLAEHLLMARQVAIKVLPRAKESDPTRLSRFLAEARAAARLDHPHIVRALHFDVEFDRHYLVMEYIDGHNLQEKIDRHGPVSPKTAASYIRQGALGLAHAHSFSLIHRDVKPANFLVDKANVVKVMDLGLARNTETTGASLTNDRTDKVLGTADYIAPEQVNDSHDVDARTDVYALGCTFYFLLTGQPPFPDGNLGQKLANHLYHSPRDIRLLRDDVPASLSKICMKMMSKKREDRFQTMKEVSDILGAWIETGGEPAPSTASPTPGKSSAGDASKSGPGVGIPKAAGDGTSSDIAAVAPAKRGSTGSTGAPAAAPSIVAPAPAAPAGPAGQTPGAANAPASSVSEKKPSRSARKGDSLSAMLVDAPLVPEDSDLSISETPTERRIRRRKPNETVRRTKHPVMTLEEVSAYLRLPIESLRVLSSEGKIPCQQIAGELRFHRRAVDQWLQETNFGSPTWATLKSKLPGVGPNAFTEGGSLAPQSGFGPASQAGYGPSSQTGFSTQQNGGFSAPANPEQMIVNNYDDLIGRMESGGLLVGDQGNRRRMLLEHEPTRDVDQLLRRLVTERMLTEYQAAMIRQGRSSELRYDDYVVIEKIGAGGMAIVYKAIQPYTGHVVAIKVLSSVSRIGADEEFRRFDREVRAAAKLDHPNIIMAYDAVFREGRNYLVLEFVDGPNLDVLIRRQGPLDVPVAVDYLLQAAKGFEHAHSKHLIHRDIKPGNLLVDSLGTVKILDMGLVRIDQGWGGNSSVFDRGERLTTAEMVLGTPEFMAPEQFLDAREADARSDVYSLGCTFYYLMTGRTPYQSGSPTRTLRAHQNDPIPSLRAMRSEVPASVEAVYQKMMQKTASQRYQSMDELVQDLEQRVIPELQELGFAPGGQGGAGSLAARGSSIWSREKIEGSGIKGLPQDFKVARDGLAGRGVRKNWLPEATLVVALGVMMGALSGLFCWWAFHPALVRGAEICAGIGAGVGVLAGVVVYWWKRD